MAPTSPTRQGVPDAVETVTQQAGAGDNESRRPVDSPKIAQPRTWSGGRAGLLSPVGLALLRLRHGWSLLLVVGVGILVAVVLICTVPLYDALVADIQLQQAITTATPTMRNLQASVGSAQISTQVRDQTNQIITSLAGSYLHSFTAPTPVYYTVSGNVFLLKAGSQTVNPVDPAAPSLIFEAFDYQTAGPHMHFVSGTVPEDAAPGQTPEVAITQQMAQDLDLKVGNLVQAGTGVSNQPLTFVVSGIWSPNESDPFWNGATFAPVASHYVNTPIASASGGPEYKLLVTYATFFNQVGQLPVTMTQNWIYYTKSSAITTNNMGNIATSIGNFRSRLNGDLLPLPAVGSVELQTSLESDIADIEAQQALLALPLYTIVGQIVGLALLFVAAMAGLLIDGQSQEIATLKSRGAGAMQLLTMFTSQGVLLGLLAALAGPFLAAGLGVALIRWLIPASTILGAGVGASYLSRIASPGTVVLLAAVGGLLGAAVMGLSAWQSARLDVLAFRREQGRSTRAPFWKRYYLDIVVAVLCLAGYLELSQFGGTSIREELGGSTDPLLLLAPALLLLAGALLVLRLFPYGAALGSRLAARRRGLVPVFAFSEVERNLSRYSRLALLLVLAVGLGLFALAFSSSLATNGYDQAAYSVGSDIRFRALADAVYSANLGIGMSGTRTLMKRLQNSPGVRGVTQVYRSQVYTTPDEGSDPVDALGIDPATFEQDAGVVSWRSDYASTPLETLLSEMRTHSLGSDAGTPDAPIWAIVSTQFASRYDLTVGDQFSLGVSFDALGITPFVVGAIVDEFPTLYPAGEPSGFIVLDLNDYLSAVRASTPLGYGINPDSFSPNEFWIHTTGSPSRQAALLHELASPGFLPGPQVQIESLAEQASQIASNPFSAGMLGLLLVGAVTAAVLAILGSIVQALLTARQRAREFAVMRTIGLSGRQLTLVLLTEQLVVYSFGLIGGTLLGLVLITSTLPFLQFSDTTINPTTVGVPPYILTIDGQSILYFYVALLIAFLVALLIASRYAASLGLGDTLRVGED